MRRLTMMLALVAAVLVAAPATAQETPKSMVDTYSALADAILGLKKAEVSFVTSVLESHYQHAMAAAMKGDHGGAAAHMALVANEGDNAIAGIRKRLIDGGHHHHHADGEGHHHADDEGHHADDEGSHHSDDQGDSAYDTGFVIVTKAAKAEMLAASAAMRSAQDEAAGKMAWEKFATAYGALFE